LALGDAASRTYSWGAARALPWAGMSEAFGIAPPEPGQLSKPQLQLAKLARNRSLGRRDAWRDACPTLSPAKFMVPIHAEKTKGGFP